MTTLLKMELLLCRFFRIRIQTTSTGFSPAESITIPPRLYFCCMLTMAIVRHTPTLPLPHTQLNQYHLDLLSGLVLSPLRTTSHIVLEDILLSLHSHAIDNENNALVPWTYNLFDCRQLLPLTSRLVALVSGLANNYSITTLYALYAHGTLERPLFVLHSQPAG